MTIHAVTIMFEGWSTEKGLPTDLAEVARKSDNLARVEEIAVRHNRSLRPDVYDKYWTDYALDLPANDATLRLISDLSDAGLTFSVSGYDHWQHPFQEAIEAMSASGNFGYD